MFYTLTKIVITTALVVLISEIAKRSTLWGGLLASVPLVSALAIVWLYIDTKDVSRVSALATSVFWLVLPSLTMFISLPLFLKRGINFYISFGLSIGIMVGFYSLTVALLSHYGVKL